MLIRLKFKHGEQEQFLLAASRKSRLTNEELAKLAGVVSRSYRDWRREKLTISRKAAELFVKKFRINLPEDENILIDRWVRQRTVANRKGGLALFAKHGSPATTEGRKKGGAKALSILRAKGIIPECKTSYVLPNHYSNELAEFVGILLGDGGITYGQACITLNREADSDYVQFVIELGTKLFGEKPRVNPRKDSKAVQIYWNGIMLVNYLTNIGLRIGNKVRQQVGVPSWVLAIPEYRKACLRGLMDTDGGVFIHKYKVGGKIYSYKKICFSNRSMPILHFVFNTLHELGFTPKIIDKVENKKVWLYNNHEVDRYLKLIETHNKRLLKHTITGG